MLYLLNKPFFSQNPEKLGTLTILGYASNMLGIIISIPALLTGDAELYAMIQVNRVYQRDERWQMRSLPAVKVALMHVRFCMPLLSRIGIDTAQAGLNNLVTVDAV